MYGNRIFFLLNVRGYTSTHDRDASKVPKTLKSSSNNNKSYRVVIILIMSKHCNVTSSIYNTYHYQYLLDTVMTWMYLPSM